MMRHEKVTALILKRKPIGEADMLLTILSLEQGKMTVKAKGIRKITSRRSASLDLFNLCTMSLYAHGTGVMPIVTEVILLDSFSGIKQDLARVGIAYHICELVDGLSPEQHIVQDVFQLTKQVLGELSACMESVAQSVHGFEVRLLTSLGYVADQDLTGNRASLFIEEILERKLKARHMLPQLL